MQPIVIDFETHPIQQRPGYPPGPVGVAIDLGDRPPFYIAWGSPIADDFDQDQYAIADYWLRTIWATGAPLLFHNAKFDLEVAEKWFNLPIPPWERVHDTMFLAYLNDPHAPDLGLKVLAHKLLDWAPEEKDAIADWVVANKREINVYDPSHPATAKGAGAWIWRAPKELVAPYAIGDVLRTRALFNYLAPIVDRTGMVPAYDRERQLMPILLRNEQAGIRLDLPRIEQDLKTYNSAFYFVEGSLRLALHKPELNFDADQDVAEALLSSGLVNELDMPRTKPSATFPSGQWSVSKEELRPELFVGELGRQVASALGYRNRLATCLKTFMTPWAAQARYNNGRITTQWNQTRNPQGGTRTGRPSTNNHNLLNIAKEFGHGNDSLTGYEEPVFLGVPPLPLCRCYILPDEGEVFIHRDFSGQELRVFAQGEQGELWNAYQRDPRVDPHKLIQDNIREITGREIERTPVKVLNFQGIYGGGVPALQRKLRCSVAEAKALKDAHDQALPGRRVLNEEIMRVIRRGDPIRTLGGRIFFAERPGLDGREKLYKLINYWVQGSAADITKQAIIDWDENPVKNARFLVTVYDEVNGSTPLEEERLQMSILQEAMERPRFGMTVPMLSEGKRGFSWGELEKCI